MGEVTRNSGDGVEPYAMRFAQLSRHRQEHSMRVAALMRDFAEIHGLPTDQAYLAGYAHDLAREMSREALLLEAQRLEIAVGAPEAREPVLLHGPVAARWLEVEGIGTADVCEAIRYHTTAAPGQSVMGQALFIADGVEPGRNFSTRAEIEELARRSLPEAYTRLLGETLKYLAGRNLSPHPLMLQAVAEMHPSRQGEPGDRLHTTFKGE